MCKLIRIFKLHNTKTIIRKKIRIKILKINIISTTFTNQILISSSPCIKIQTTNNNFILLILKEQTFRG